MGKFDGYLICSDLDGTMNLQGEVVESNIEAIRYFQENGGYFTICSGRNPEYLRQFLDKVDPNTFVIGYGGAKGVNLHPGEVLFEAVYTEEMKDIYRDMIAVSCGVRTAFFHFTGEPSYTTFTFEEYLAKEDEILSHSISKAGITYFEEEDCSRATLLLVEKYKNVPVELVRSYYRCLELISENGSKRSASHKLKEALGAHTLICVGNFENDISMIEGADIGYAVGDSLDSVKAIADRITVDASEGAIRAVIEDIERELR